MDRLTIRTQKGAALKLNNPQNEIEARKQLHDKYLIAIEKLAHYEDMEELRRLTELPCAVGDAVWEIDEYATGFKARPMTVLSIKLKENKGFVYTAYSDEHDNFVRGYGFDDFGEILFLTKEEAKRKLKELE